MREIDPRGGQRRRIRQVRRRKPHDTLAGPGKGREGRQHQLQLADAFAPAENLGQGAHRPAAARQLAVELGKAARHRGRAAGKRAAAPDRMALQDVFERGRHAVFIYSTEADGKGSRRWQVHTAHDMIFR